MAPPALRLEQLENRVTPSILSTVELDGNATTGVLGTSGSTTTSHDWDQVYADAGSPSGSAAFVNGPTSAAIAGSFVTDQVNSTADDIFQGGGSKDTQGIQNWLFTASKPQPKDDITHAYAAAYNDPTSGHTLLYAGLDRFANSGNSTAGFWFFTNQIGENPNVTTNGGHPFTGQHQTGDILLISNFTQGGSVSTIAVYEWVGNDSTGSLKFIGGNSTDTFAIVNGAPVSVPWQFTNKAGATQPDTGEFLEEGVDLTDLGLSGCFSSFLAETRSSQSPTATLSDLTLGSFDVCSIEPTPFSGLSKFDTFTNQGDFVTYPLTVQNTGALPLYLQNVSDTVLGNIVVNGVVQKPAYPVTAIDASALATNTPLMPGQTLTIFVTRQVQATDPDPTNDTTTFLFSDKANFSGAQITTSEVNSVNLFQPSATMTETASPPAGVVGTPTTYTYTIDNTSSTDSPNLILDPSNPNSFLTDSLFPNIEADAIAAAIAAGDGANGVMSLPPGASFSFTETRDLMAGDPTPLTDKATAGFTLAQNLGSFTNVIHASASTTTRIVNAEISIAGSGVNEINNPHTFVVTVKEDLGDGNGFVAAANEPVTVTLANTNGSTTSPTTFGLTTNSSGQASVTFTSATAGEVIGNASTTFSVEGATLTRATGDSHAGDSGPATKFFEDANISISPNATNGITEPHTFTVTVTENAGDGKGYVAAANDPVTVTLTGQNGAVPMAETPLSGTTNANGQFQVTFTSDSAGQILGNASTSFTLNGVTLSRTTNGLAGDSGPATKTFVAGKILWEKVDESGNLLGGATFLVTATSGTAAGLSPTSILVTDNGSFDANKTNGLFELDAFQSFGGSNLTGLALGTYTIQEVTPPPGYTLDPKILTVTLTQSALTGNLTGTPFVDTLPNLNIVKTVTANQTVIHPGDTASFTITVANPGKGTANNVVMTDNLPDANMLTWTVTSFTGFTTASISGGVLTASEAGMVGGGTASVVVSAVVPLNFFGNGGGTGTGNGDPVPLNLFELDGNATTGVLGTSGSTTTSHDWDQVYADNTANPKTNTAGAIASSFVNDPINTTKDDIFTGGGSKDPNALSQWQFKNGKPQGKDDIENAFAALYKDPSTGDQVLYAGLTRFDNSGDSTAGFWFFVNPISENANGTFSGTHSDGDILLVSDFTIGGSVSTIRVYEWLGGNLVLVNTGNLANGTTFAIVNSGPISVPWSYVNKSGATSPDHGEFLEEGINLTGLGLNGCFSTFLAETRSSQSVTATLSDLVLGNFSTCDVMLPNIASVKADNFNNGQPITSNMVSIDLNDGDPQLAVSAGNGAGTASLTEAQLQPIVAQAIAAWRAAGADPAALSNVANYAIHIANLPDGELGYEVPGQIWIDATAAGWGWSTDSIPEAGRMDLLTVVSHEVGHLLGFGDHAGGNDVMTTTLDPGMRRLPEAAAIPGTDTGTVFVSRAANVGAAQPPAALPAVSSTAAVDAVFAAATRGVTAAATVQDGAAGQAGVPLTLVPQAAVIPPAVTAPPVTAVVGPDREASGDAVPGVRPPLPRMDGGNAVRPDDETQGVDQAEAAAANPSFWQCVSDACFAGDSWTDDRADTTGILPGVSAPDAATASAALALMLGGWWGARPVETEARKRRRFHV